MEELVAGLLRPRLFPFGKLSKAKSAAHPLSLLRPLPLLRFASSFFLRPLSSLSTSSSPTLLRSFYSLLTSSSSFFLKSLPFLLFYFKFSFFSDLFLSPSLYRLPLSSSYIFICHFLGSFFDFPPLVFFRHFYLSFLIHN